MMMVTLPQYVELNAQIQLVHYHIVVIRNSNLVVCSCRLCVVIFARAFEKVISRTCHAKVYEQGYHYTATNFAECHMLAMMVERRTRSNEAFYQDRGPNEDCVCSHEPQSTHVANGSIVLGKLGNAPLISFVI